MHSKSSTDWDSRLRPDGRTRSSPARHRFELGAYLRAREVEAWLDSELPKSTVSSLSTSFSGKNLAVRKWTTDRDNRPDD